MDQSTVSKAVDNLRRMSDLVMSLPVAYLGFHKGGQILSGH